MLGSYTCSLTLEMSNGRPADAPKSDAEELCVLVARDANEGHGRLFLMALRLPQDPDLVDRNCRWSMGEEG